MRTEVIGQEPQRSQAQPLHFSLYYNEGIVATVFLPTHYATRRFYEQIFKNIDKICLFSLK